MIIPYFRYRFRARNEHSLHSPFLFDLYTRTIRPKASKSITTVQPQIEALRTNLQKSREHIEVLDLGAGSRLGAYRSRTIGSIARTSAKPAKYGQLLFRLAQRFQPKTVFDLGTSLGLTTAYLAKAVEPFSGQVITFEGCPETAKKASQHLSELGCKSVNIVVGNLDTILAEEVAKCKQLDFVFFDANHRYEPTIQYFNTCLGKIYNDSVFIFDDIHWSADMERAWADIQRHPFVTLTVDLFGIGIVFFRQEQPKQHFVLRF